MERLRAAAGRRRARRHGEGPRAGRPPLHPAVPVLRRPAQRLPVLAADFVTTEDGTGVVHIAPGLRRGRPDGCGEATGIPVVVPVDCRRPLHRRGRAVRRACTCSTPTPRSSAPSRTRASWCATTPTTTPTRTAGGAPARSCTGPSRLVRAGHRVPRPHGGAEPADHAGCPAHVQRRQLRQVAGERPRLVDQPEPVLGFAHPGLEERRPGLPTRRRLRQPRRARARLRRAARPTSTARWSTSSSAPTPTTRPVGR